MPDEVLKEMKEVELSGEKVTLENHSERILGFNGSDPKCYIELIPGLNKVPVEWFDSIKKKDYWKTHKELNHVSKLKAPTPEKKTSKKKKKSKK